MESRYTHSRACARPNVWAGSVGEKKMDSLVGQFNVKVEELRVLQRGVRCMPDAMHNVNRGERETSVSFLCSTVEFWYEESVPLRRDTHGMTHKSLHPEPEVFRTVRPLSQGSQVWKRTYGQSSKMVAGDSIGLGGGVKRAEVKECQPCKSPRRQG